MKYDQKVHHSQSIRLKNYDYSQAGLYFITVCVQNRECIFGEIVNDEMALNDVGKMVQSQWLALSHRFYGIEINEYTVMPNHFH
jgi:REP element-mobilizing transposase RayT